jgi:hypothetical protein
MNHKGYEAVYSDRSSSTFRKNLLPSSSELCCMLVAYSAYTSTLMMAAGRSSET